MGYLISVPATSANLGPGFDTLGLALDLRMQVAARPAETWEIHLEGLGGEVLPRDSSNMIAQACLHGLELAGASEVCYRLHVVNPIPVSRGLGSSATAIVTGLALAQLTVRGTLDLDDLFQQAAAYERHPDNVAPAVYGGLCVCSQNPDGSFVRREGALDPRIRVLAVIPEQNTSTSKMRGILPKSYTREVLDQNEQALQALLDGLARGDAAGLAHSEKDQIHQPYRLDAQPVSKQAYTLLREQTWVAGAFLSGSGATVAGWVVGEQDPSDAFRELLAQRNIKAAVHFLEVDHRGVVWEALDDASP